MNEIKISNRYEIIYYKTSLFVVAKLHIDYMENRFRDKQIVAECQEEFLNFVAWLESLISTLTQVTFLPKTSMADTGFYRRGSTY